MTTPRSLTFVASCSILFAGLAVACESPAPDGDTTQTGDGDGDGDTTQTGDGDGDGDTTQTGDGDGDDCASPVDVLLVVDNSGSMALAQAKVAEAISFSLTILDGVDWRIGITTTDNGNPWCPNGVTTPEAGNLVLSSCKSRLDQFVFNGDNSAQDIACNNVCLYDDIAISPTTTQFDANPAPRPWIERIDGVTNLADNLDPAQALACLIPMGVNGCGFEQPLEASYLALTRAQSPGEASYGFLRSDANLLVVLITDEVDCSYNQDWSSMFEADGNKVFWSDPLAAVPTSAVCWNAGVECVGDPSGYDSCDPVNLDINGTPGAGVDEAVLHPLSRYTDLIASIEAQRKAINPNARVQLSVLGGRAEVGMWIYADSEDPVFQDSFGIGPGCTTDDGIQALPPVRMRDVAYQTGGTINSMCRSNQTSALAELVDYYTCGGDW